MNPYEKMSVSELIEEQDRYLYRHLDNGGRSEFDKSINEISRALIAALRRECGACYLTNFYLPKQVTKTAGNCYTPYTGQKIYNADFQIATPTQDDELKRLIVAYNTPPTKGSIEMLNRIYERLKEIGGLALLWA